MRRLYHATIALAFLGVVVERAVADDADLIRALKSHAATVKHLGDALQQAQKTHDDGRDAADRMLRSAYGLAIELALSRGDKQQAARLREQRRQLDPMKIEPTVDASDEPLFECALGVYGQAIRGKRRPFVNLRPPNRNLWTDKIESRLDGVLSYGQVDYIGTAKLVIPKTAWYTIDLPGAGVQLRISGKLVSTGDVQLREGVHDVEIYTNHWGQPYLKYAQASVLSDGDAKRIPFVNTGAAIEEFLSKKIDGKPIVEVTGYKPPRVD